ncbi:MULTISPECIES: FtsW/RodA/SpoVE family cell cycle protein [unclassified Pseudofrankia]|uniref:FtsW/RodA/SpoVE family cell cycle protein n=1 Tax=unclassified Pseudofrankia TaxID=2994372 RepID=UPI0009F479E0|nr:MULTISPECIES: FtsW/RodA/SpoVE family cell cycle protein [unclassified Pseudofrankia]MDT3445524.1 FtsW/RodA/SpoVE family cell cycle protein [Pseudofrankia sp. BMG5.37]
MTLPPRRQWSANLTSAFARVPSPQGVELPPYRRSELVLLVAAGILTTAALSALTLAHDGHLTYHIATYALGFYVLWGFVHLAMRRFAPAADPLLMPLCAALNGLGLVMIYRLDLARSDAAKQAGRAIPPSAAHTQIVWTALSVIVFALVLALVRNHSTLARYTFTAGLAGLVFLCLPALPGIGATINGARLWLRVGPFSFQPSEISKILLAIFFAGYLRTFGALMSAHVVTKARRRSTGNAAAALTGAIRRLRPGAHGPGEPAAPADVTDSSGTYTGVISRVWSKGPRFYVPAILTWVAGLGVLVIERDLGSSLLFFGMFLVVLYVASERARFVVVGLGLFIAAALAAYHLFSHVQVRVDIWLHAFDGTNPSNKSYQLVQGLYGFAAGGITGTGLGRGHPNKVPFANTDFIMASLGEELGLTGVMAILMMYLLIVVRGMRVALTAPDPFGKLLATALAATLGIQVFVQVGGVMRLIPLTGVTLPFVSYGGSSLVANAAIIALLLRISDTVRRRQAEAQEVLEVEPDQVANVQTEIVRRVEVPETQETHEPAE